MLLQHPIYPLIITLFTLFLVVIQSIQNEKIFKNRFILAICNMTIFIIVLIAFYQTTIFRDEGVIQNIYIGYTFFTYFIFLLVLYSTFKLATLKANHYQLFVKTIKNSKRNAYYVVDQRERIKDISLSLLSELGLEKEDVIGKKLFTILNKTVRITKLNDTEINNKWLEGYYSTYKEEAKPFDSENQEIHLLNHEGNQIVLNTVMQPVFVLGKYKGRIVVGEKKLSSDLLAVEKELNERSNELESIRHKFIATLSLSEDGLFYIDLDKRTLWASDSLVKSLKLPDNLVDLTSFRHLIEPEDLNKYLAVLGDLSVSKHQYSTSYRILVNGQYAWFKEKGKRLFEDPSGSFIMGVINPLKTRHFQSSEIEVLDNIKDKNDMLVSCKKSFDENRYFQLMVLNLRNIPKINELHGREFGNLVMGEYIKKLKDTFVSTHGEVFRITGIEFAVLITDPRKMEILNQGLRGNKTYLNLPVSYGSIQTELEVYAGIATGGSDAHDEFQIYQAASQALKIAQNPQYESNGCYYKDIAS